jgi:hypothetical protein
MKRKLLRIAVAGVPRACGAAPRSRRTLYRDNYTYRLGRAPTGT